MNEKIRKVFEQAKRRRQTSSAQLPILLALIGSALLATHYIPDGHWGPWQVFSPKKFAQIFLSLTFIQSFSAFLSQLLGHRVSLILSSALGGLVSSTAVTMDLARQSKNIGTRAPLAGILLATLAMAGEAMLIAYLGSPGLFWRLFPSLLFFFFTAIAAYFLIIPRLGMGQESAHLEVHFSWKASLRLSLALAGMLALVNAAKSSLGTQSATLVSCLGALFELHSVVFANANLNGFNGLNGDAAISHSHSTILLCLNSALASKIGLAWILGSKKLGFYVSALFIALAITLWIPYWFLQLVN